MFKDVTKRLCAKIIGFVFFIAGTLKLMDPAGSALIVREYLNFFHVGFLSGTAGVIGEVFALLETLCGVCLVTGVFRKVAAWTVSILLGGFTLLTLVLWIANPEMDCGCFGEAIHLTHFQSFAKNMVLCILAVIAFWPFKDFGSPSRKKYVTAAVIGASWIGFAIYSLLCIPMLQLTPFSLSSRLSAAAGLPETTTDEYISTFIYEKNGKQGVFTLNKLPDSTWTFVETRTVKKEDNIRETDFPELSFTDREGEYRDTLAAAGNVIVFSVTRPDRIRERRWRSVAEAAGKASEAGFDVLVLMSGSFDGMEAAMRKNLPAEVAGALLEQCYMADYRTLISLNRSNGGAVYFNDGNIIQKWAATSLPDGKELNGIIRRNSTEVMLKADSRGRLAFQTYMLYTLSLLLLI